MKRNALFAFVAALGFAVSAHAVTYDVTIAFDTDRNTTTGCTLTTPAGTFAGAEQLVVTHVNVVGSVATTTGVTRQACGGGVFGGAVPVDTHSWPAGLTTGGTLFIETHVTPTELGATSMSPMRVGFFVTNGTLSDAVTTSHGAVVLLPDGLRHRAVVPATARTITLDGNDSDWHGISPIADGGAGSPDLRILNAYALIQPSDIFFGIRLQANHNAPTARDDVYALPTVGGTLSVPAASGVLANDNDPNSLPLTTTLVADVQHGTLTLNGNGSFDYTHDGSSAQLDTFEYKDSNGTLESNTAQVQIGIGAGGGPTPPPTPAFTSADHVTFTAGTFGTFTVVTTPAHPTPAITLQSGSLPNGVTLHDNGDGTATLSGTPLINSCGVFPLVLKAQNVVGQATQNFTLTVNQAPNFTSPNSTTFTVGVNGSFTVSAFGCPTPSISKSGALPAGVTFTDNGNGSASLQGTPAPGTAGIYTLLLSATNSSGTATQTFTLTVACGGTISVTNPAVNTGTAGTAFSQTFTQSGGVGAVTFTLNSGTLPAGLTLSTAGVLSGTPTQTGTFPITVKATDSQGCFGIGPTYNLTINCQTITVTNPATTTGTVNAAFSQTFTAANTIGTVTFSTASTLPTGLTLATNGTLSGTPTQTGTFPIVVKATDANGCFGNGATYNLVIGCQTVTVNNPATNTGTVNVAFSQTFTATNTIGTVTFTTASTLPAGLTLATNGTLSGTPTQTGTFPIVVKATDANGCFGNGATYNLTINCQTITVNSPGVNTGTVNVAFSQTFTATNAVGTVTFTTASALPTGITLATNGTLSGTPTQTGTFPIVVTATDANGCTGTSGTYNLTINCQTITVNNPGVSSGTVNTAFSQNFTAGNTIGTVTFTTVSTLPTGLTLATNGTLSGTPTQTGSFPIVVTATDANGCSGNGATYTLVIGCQVITVTNPGVNTGTVNTAFSQNFTAGNTIGTVTFTTASTLPAGLTLATNGTLSGTPTQTGSFPIVVTATDANGCSGSGPTYTLTIGCQIITVNNPANTTGTVNAAFSETFTASNAIGTVTFTTASTLPAGLTLATNGTLSGTPTQTGSFPIVVHAVDANGCAGDSPTYTLVIGCQTITVTNPGVNTGTVNVAFSQSFSASNTIGTVTFTTASTLPTGITLSTAGLLSGTPTQPGTFPIVVTATDANGCTGNGATYNLIISCQTITVNNPSSNSSPAGTPLPAANFTFTQSGAIGGATFTTASTLPTGVSLTTAGVLTGTPTQGGSFPIVVTVTDGNGCTGTNPAYTLTITCPVITVTNPANSTGTAGVAFSEQFTQSGGQGTITWSESGALPTGFSFNTTNGVLSGTTSQVGTFPIIVTATDSNGCQGAGATYNLTINCQTITVTNPGVNTGTVDAAFSQTFTVTGILGTVTWSETGALPAGITLDSSTGVLAGTPTVNGVFPITVIATDTNGCTGSSPYTLTINCQTITVTNPVTNTGTVDAPFSQNFSQSGAHGTASFTTASTLPAGLTLSTAGVLSGTPTQAGNFPIVVVVTDSNGCTGTGATYNLTINCQTITVTNPVTNTGTVGQPFSQNFTQTGAHGTATFTTASTLPTGFTLSAAGVLSGTTNQFGTFPIVVTVTDSNGCTGTGATYNLTINCQTITVTNPVNTSGTVNAAFSEQFTQTGGIGGGNFTTASTLPTGLSLSTSGLLSGTPTQSGTFNIDVTFTDGNGCTGTGPTYVLIIGCQTITVTNPANDTGTAGTLFSEQFTQTGAVGTVTWSVNGALPAGISIAPATGILSGTTTQVGTFPITVTATDSNGCTGTGPTYNLTFNCQTISITNPIQNSVQAGSSLTPASDWTFSATGILATANWTIDSGTLPSGILLNAGTGVLSGSSTQQGTFPLVVRVTDTNGCFATSSYTLTVTCPTITVTRTGGGSFPAATFNLGYPAGNSFTASGGSGNYHWAFQSGTQPPGINLTIAAGTLSGIPSATGTFSMTVIATDQVTGCTGQATFTFTIKPAMGADTYNNLVNNTEAYVTGGSTAAPATPAVQLSGTIVSNDTPASGVTVDASSIGTFATTQGGSVTIAADGTFKYTPPLTNLTTDSFSYTGTSNTGTVPSIPQYAPSTGPATNTGTVTLNLANRVWYVKNNGAAGNGQSQSPFNTLAAAQGASAASDIIFVYNGDGTTTGQNAGITLKANQQLIGEGVALVVNGNTLVVAGTKPQITNTAATSDVVTLNDGNTVKGATITGTAGARDGISSVSAHAGFTADTITVQNNVNVGVDLISMTGTVTITNSTISTVGNQALTINNGTAAVTVDNTNTVNGGTGTAVSVLNRPAAAGAIAIGATITGGQIQLLSNVSGTISFTGSQTLSNTTVNGVTMTTNAGATINFSGTLNVTTTTGVPFQASGGGTLNVTGTANLTSGAAANGLSLNGITIGGSGVTFTSVNTTGATTAINLVNFTAAGTVTVNGGTITNGTTGVSLQGTNTSLTLAGVTITGPTTGITNTTNFGTLTIGASVNVTAATALNLISGAVSGTFANVSSTGGNNGVILNAVTGSWGTTAGSLTGATTVTFSVTGGGGGTISWGGTINQAGASFVVTIAGGNSNTINFSGNVTTSGASAGISISGNSGTYNFTGATSTIAGTGGGIDISNESGTISFGAGYNISAATTSFKIGGNANNVSTNITYSGVITNNNNGGVILDIFSAGTGSYSGTLSMNGTSLSGNVAGLNGVVSIIKNVTGSATVNNLSETAGNNNFAGTMVAISASSGSLTFNNLDLLANGNGGGGNTGKGLTMTGGGTLAVTATGGTSTIDVGSTALDLNGTTIVASTLATVSSSGRGTTSAVSLVNVAGAALTMSGGALAGNGSAGTFVVTGGGSNITYNGTIAQTLAQRVVNVSGRTGGTVAFGGAITGSGTCTGITLGGSGGTVTISGGITLNGASDTFSATTAGLTVNVTGTNTIGATTPPTGPAVNIASATIGGSNVTFRSVSATGGTNGIIINNVGAGTFTVTGNAGTCTSLVSTCTGGTIQNTTSHAVTLNSTTSPSLNFMKITNIGTSGIFGTNVTNFTLANSVIDGVNTSHTGADSNVAFNTGVSGTETNVSGTVSITNNTLNNSYQAGIDIQNYSGTISSLTITNNSMTSNTSNTLSLGTAINVVANRGGANHANISAGTISSNSITNFPVGAGIQVIGGNSNSGQAVTIASTGSPFIINSNTITGSGPAGAGMGTNGIAVTAGESTSAFFQIGASGAANNITNVRGNGIACSLFGNGTEKCIIQFNVLVTNNTAGSAGINTGADQSVAGGSAGVGTLYLDIHNNNVSGNTGNDILSTVRSVSSNGIFHIENNTVAQPTTSSGTIYGIRVDSGNGVGSPTVCLKINGNTTTGSTNGVTTAPGIGLRQSHVDPSGGIGTFQIQGLAPSPSNDAQMEAYVGNAGQNPGSANGTFGATGVASISAGGTFTANTCTIP
jgi:hypothetical protein